MSENLSTSVKNTESSKTSPGKQHQSSNTLDEECSGSIASLGSLRKKQSFFGSLRHTKKKNKSIEILRGRDSYADEIDPVRWQVSNVLRDSKVQISHTREESNLFMDVSL
jgi:hypothetical protein